MLRKTVTIAVIIGLLGGLWVPRAEAGDKEWATAGKILAGIAALSILSNAAEGHHYRHRDYYDRRVYYAEPVYRERRVYQHRAPRTYIRHKQWVPGHYVTENVRVWVPGEKVKIWVEPQYEKIWIGDEHDGYWEEVLVEEGHWAYQYRRGHYEVQTDKRWVPGYWKYI